MWQNISENLQRNGCCSKSSSHAFDELQTTKPYAAQVTSLGARSRVSSIQQKVKEFSP